MSRQIFFAHANGFPSATYGKLFDALTPDFNVACLAQHGHDPRFPVDNNWHNLVDELIFHLQQQSGPVLGVGHSLGGMLHLHAAIRCPHLYKGVVMLDSPVLTLTDRWVIRAAKRFGLIDRLTPAGRTLGRREEFDDREAARAYFSGKSLFRSFDPDCFEAYLQHGLFSTLLEKVFSVLGADHRAIGLFSPVLRGANPALLAGMAFGGALTFARKKKSSSKRKVG